ncbi:DUF2691 family protein [Cytobacillus solani]|uniref:DUF2691 family protein n=1 Tax=Cytobacillus solani TaxID=1637975 RepID=UPI0015EEBDB8|nr:DUF2691 family protein [Cytobacillus solani]
MKRGISFEIPNKYGNFLGKILKPIEMSKLNWHVENVESYLVVKDQLADELFPQQLNGMAGMGLRDYLENNTYYLIFADVKPHQKNRSRSYYRHHRNRVIQRKIKIAKQLEWQSRFTGYFAKGKVHCSCWMCTQKTNRNGYPHSQIMQLERLESLLCDYFNEGEF